MKTARDNGNRWGTNVAPGSLTQSSGVTANGREKADSRDDDSPISRWRKSRNAEGSISATPASSASASRVRTSDVTAKNQEPSKATPYSRRTIETFPVGKVDAPTSSVPSTVSRSSAPVVNGREKADSRGDDSPIIRWRKSRNAEGSISATPASSASASRVRTSDVTAKNQEPSKATPYSRRTIETFPVGKVDAPTSSVPSTVSRWRKSRNAEGSISATPASSASASRVRTSDVTAKNQEPSKATPYSRRTIETFPVGKVDAPTSSVPSTVSRSSAPVVNGREKADSRGDDSPIIRWRKSRNAEGSISATPASSASASRVRTSDVTAKNQEPSKATPYSRRTIETFPVGKVDAPTSSVPSTVSRSSAPVVNGREKADSRGDDSPISRWRKSRNAEGSKSAPVIENRSTPPVSTSVPSRGGPTERGSVRASKDTSCFDVSESAAGKQTTEYNVYYTRDRPFQWQSSSNKVSAKPPIVVQNVRPPLRHSPRPVRDAEKEGTETREIVVPYGRDSKRHGKSPVANVISPVWPVRSEESESEDFPSFTSIRRSVQGGHIPLHTQNDGQAEWRENIVWSARQRRGSPRRPSRYGGSRLSSCNGTPIGRSASAFNAPRMSSDNEELANFLGSYSNRPRRYSSTTVLRDKTRFQSVVPNRLVELPTSVHNSACRKEVTKSPDKKYNLLDDECDESSALLEEELSSLLLSLEMYQKRLERAAVIVNLERQRRTRS
ncbi:hypothetical protein LSM04_002469 [Trypanosoma melophagium]|uniref:uncharacterized protein n=1 Tax=Trypanosoma melophagium TaxID=715481 RepID=UPI00351A2BC9|nr:hypothetical protein LSM04_002469 [Trypanosoma melophagium]